MQDRAQKTYNRSMEIEKIQLSADVVGINTSQLAEVLFPGYWSQGAFMNIDHDTWMSALMKWCADNGAHYYARGREEFSLDEALEETIAAGKKICVYEDLS